MRQLGKGCWKSGVSWMFIFKVSGPLDSFLIRSLSSIKLGVGSDTISNITKEVLVDAGAPDDYKATPSEWQLPLTWWTVEF